MASTFIFSPGGSPAQQAAAADFLSRVDATNKKAAADKANEDKPPGVSGNKIYSVSNFKFTIDKDTFAVMTLQLSLQLSGIPTVVATINPKPNPVAATVESADVEDFASWLATLQSKVNTPSGKASLSFTMASSDGDDIQEVKLTDWPLTQVGFGNIAAAGGFNTFVTLQHPIYRATKAVLAMLNTYKGAASGEAIGAAGDSDIVSLVLESMTKYLDQKDPNAAAADVVETGQVIDATSIESLDKVIHAAAVKAVGVLKDNIEWGPYDGSNIPFATTVSNFYTYLTLLGGLDIGAYLERDSPYAVLMSMLSQMMIVTYGDFSDDKIHAVPIEPWRQSDMTVYTTELSQIDMPMYAINPISAVAILSQGAIIDYLNTEAGNVTNAGNLLASNAVIAGGYFTYAAILEGYVRVIGIPNWIASYSRGTPSGNATDNQDGMNNLDTTAEGGQNSTADVSRIKLTDNLVAILNAYAEDEFWNRYKSDTAASMGLRLMISKKTKMLRPGRVVVLRSPDDKDILTCYIVQVQHTIDVPGARAQTSIVGNRVRGPKGIKDVYKPDEDRKSVIYSGGAAPAEQPPTKPSESAKDTAAKESTPAEAYKGFAAGNPDLSGPWTSSV